MKVLLLAAILMAATSAKRVGFTATLPAGERLPVTARTCFESGSALGTSNVSGSGRSSSVVDIWLVTGKSNGQHLGFIVQAQHGSYWIENLMPGDYVKMQSTDMAILQSPVYKIVGCFKHPLTLK